MAQPRIEEELEARLRDAAYTAVGLGVLGWRFSEPHRQRLTEELREVAEYHRDLDQQRREEFVEQLKDAGEDLRLAAERLFKR